MSLKKTLSRGFDCALLYLLSQICYIGLFKLFGIDPRVLVPEKIDRIEYTLDMVFFITIIMPVIEEVLFRGPIRYLVYSKSSKYKVLIMLFVTSVLFGFLHIYNYDNPYGIPAAVYSGSKVIGGAIFGLAVIKYNSLAVSIVAHCLVNSILTALILTKI